MRYLDSLSVTQLLVRRMGHLKTDQQNTLCWLTISKSKDLPKVSCIGSTLSLRSNWVFKQVTPVSHSNLRLTGRITESGVGKRSHAGLTLLKVIDSSTKGFSEILSDVL